MATLLPALKNYGYTTIIRFRLYTTTYVTLTHIVYGLTGTLNHHLRRTGLIFQENQQRDHKSPRIPTPRTPYQNTHHITRVEAKLPFNINNNGSRNSPFNDTHG